MAATPKSPLYGISARDGPPFPGWRTDAVSWLIGSVSPYSGGNWSVVKKVAASSTNSPGVHWSSFASLQIIWNVG